MSKQDQEKFQFQRQLHPVARLRPILPKPPVIHPGIQGNQIFQLNLIGSERCSYGVTQEPQADHLKAASIGSICSSGYSNEQRQSSLNQGELSNVPSADQLTLVNATSAKTSTAVSEGIDRQHLECSSDLPVHPKVSAQQNIWIDGKCAPSKDQNVDLKLFVVGPSAREQTSKFLQIPVDQRTFYRHAPASQDSMTEKADEEEDVEVIRETYLAPMASESTHSNKTKSTPKMTVEEIKMRASKRKNSTPPAKPFLDVTSFLSSSRKAVKLTPNVTSKVEDGVNLSFPADFLMRGQGSSISCTDADKLLFPEPRRQLSALPAGQVCDEGSSLLIHALQHSLMMRHILDNLEHDIAALKLKVKDAIESREKAKEWASKVEKLLAERTKELSERNTEVKRLNKKVDLLVEEAKDAESFIVTKTRAQLFKQFLEGKSTTWDAQGELDFFLSNVGDASDLASGDEARKDGDATGDVGVSRTGSALAVDDLTGVVGAIGDIDGADA